LGWLIITKKFLVVNIKRGGFEEKSRTGTKFALVFGSGGVQFIKSGKRKRRAVSAALRFRVIFRVIF
jgi:hypothetical protein